MTERGLEIAGKPANNRYARPNPIRSFKEAMAFIGEQNIFDWHTIALEVLYNLLGLDNWHIRIVGTMQHQRGRLDPIDLMNRREVTQHVAFGLRVAILALRDRGHPRFGMRKERLKIDHP